MDREHTSDKIPDRLTAYLETSPGDRIFRRRAVFARANGEWTLVCCTVEGFPSRDMPRAVPPRTYQQAILYEDSLTTAECQNFALELQAGHAHLGNIELRRTLTPSQWFSERVPVNNEYSSHAGLVVSLRLGQTGIRASVGPLLAPDCAYYPDIDDAARDWLPFPVYHGSSDARFEHVLFLLPETRAFVAGAAFSEKRQLDITIAGTEVEKISLLVKGAYWEGRSMRHMEAVVRESNATLDVPEDADRLEFYLIDSAGVVYDFRREDQWSRLREGQATLGRVDRTLLEQVRKAVNEGEGSRIEFKPFIDLERIAPGDRKTKFHELVRTVVAFANTDGGLICLGVDDDCTISGIDAKLAQWAGGSVDQQGISRYLGALKSRIKGLVQGEVGLRLTAVEIDGVLLAVVEVAPAESKPISVVQDYCLYVRTGASNRKVPPEQWQTILEPAKQERVF